MCNCRCDGVLDMLLITNAGGHSLKQKNLFGLMVSEASVWPAGFCGREAWQERIIMGKGHSRGNRVGQEAERSNNTQ